MKRGLISLAIVLAAFDVVSAVDDGPVTKAAPQQSMR